MEYSPEEKLSLNWWKLQFKIAVLENGFLFSVYDIAIDSNMVVFAATPSELETIAFKWLEGVNLKKTMEKQLKIKSSAEPTGGWPIA